MFEEVTPDSLRTTAPKIVGQVADDTLNALIQQANLIALADGMPKRVKVNDNIIPVLNMATLDMTLHLASISNGKSGQGIISEKVDVLEKHYADTTSRGWLGSSKWGLAYLRLYRLFGAGNTPRLAVIPH
ncbi:DUF4054 domain-containing protein [Lactobacillus crispatus]|uniref:DUF4054 domain-containing protein n=1 Tax=Lactobacillus crispatus TaxID=47770 RepID=UPI00103C50EA|nr:DUF4054 domain-containing protein [Lactobacillus crispatus]